MFTYLVIDIHDHPDADIEQYFDECHAFIDKGPKPNLHLKSVYTTTGMDPSGSELIVALTLAITLALTLALTLAP